jgi:hypothetical protein
VQSSSFHDAAEIIERAHLDLLVEKLDPFRPEPGEGGDLAQVTGELLLERVQEREMAGLDDVGDLAGQVPSDPRQFGEVRSRRQQISHALRQALDRAGGTAVGAHAKLILPLDLEEIGGLIEHRRDFSILDRHSRSLDVAGMHQRPRGLPYRTPAVRVLMQIRGRKRAT